MWSRRVLRNDSRHLATPFSDSFLSKATFSTGHRKPAAAYPPLLVFSAAAAGVAATLAFQKFAISNKPAETNPTLPQTGITNQVPDLNHLGPPDRIEHLPAITAEEVDVRLSQSAYSCRDSTILGVDKYDGAQVGSNSICEDAYIHGKISNPLKTGGGADWMVWGVFDGHNGWQTSELLTKHLLPFVQRALQNIEPSNGMISDAQIHDAMETAFRVLDDALVQSAEAVIDSELSYPEKVKRLEPAESGACALLTLYDPSSRKLHVASTGDCRAVMGFKSVEGHWEARALTRDQTGSNQDEIARLRAQFPDEPNIFLRKGRVYGMEPSRSFGDGVYKWNTKLRERLRTEYNAFKQPAASWFPGMGDSPYLTASPVVNTIQLLTGGSPSFLIQATDGLWDTMGNQNAVDLVSRWSEKQETLEYGGEKSGLLSSGPVKFGRSGCWYSDSRATYRDSNAAIHLIRNAFGGAHEEMVRGALSYTSPLSRWIRDDVTVQVVFFDGQDQ